MKILGIDPGFGRAGFAVIEKESGVLKLITSECFETSKEDSFEKRLHMVGERLEELIKKHKPNSLAIEKLFFAKNKKTAMEIAEVRGMCLFIANQQGVEIHEYTPNQVKSGITGNGSADKKQVIGMLSHLIAIDMSEKRYDDEYDAIAIGITHIASLSGYKRS